MKIEHEVISAVVSHFLKNQPISVLSNMLFHKAKQIKDRHEIVKHSATMIVKDDECNIRIHRNDVCPRVLQDVEKAENLTTQLEITIEGEIVNVMIDYEPNTMWFNIKSKKFDEVFEKAKEMAKE